MQPRVAFEVGCEIHDQPALAPGVNLTLFSCIFLGSTSRPFGVDYTCGWAGEVRLGWQ
jgi:hypothetical protein